MSNLLVDINRAFTDAQHEDFEAGMESNFERRLTELVRGGMFLALTYIGDRCQDPQESPLVVGKALAIIGRVQHAPTRLRRLKLLQAFLFHGKHPVRRGAILGLSHLNDTLCLPDVRQAFAAEQQPYLMSMLRQLINQLERRHDYNPA